MFVHGHYLFLEAHSFPSSFALGKLSASRKHPILSVEKYPFMFSRQIEASLTYQYQNTIVITGNDKSELGCYRYLDV